MSQRKDKNNGIRSMQGSIRAMEGEGNERKFIISFSSEEPYERWFGTEILSHDAGAVDLTRLNEIGVVLFNHNVDKVVGKILRAWVEDGRGNAEIEFDDDNYAEVIYQKVKSGTLKGVSVRYKVGCWEEVKEGYTSSNGKHKGPCSIATKWMGLEISIVSVPADATVGVGRNMDGDDGLSALWAKQIEVNKNYLM
ncbi:HK97 family phage prohead protease [Anaerotignum sp.]